jgi:hypothetical protein
MNQQQMRRMLLAAMLAAPLAAMAGAPLVTVYKSATCGCCSEWIKHLKANGFAVKALDVADPSLHRKQAGIPDQYGSCHTGMVNGYALEGHVPAAEIHRLLKEKPKAIGLAVPAMPLGSPGMEGPRKDPYDVLLIQRNGRATVYKHYN